MDSRHFVEKIVSLSNISWDYTVLYPNTLLWPSLMAFNVEIGITTDFSDVLFGSLTTWCSW